ncbi:uncharacterized protein A1O9_11102 [Exophiala aquamarina CBS 119918]|uniref:Copper transport protein n=1 Tax=Exophiala aquamarina CBS 119918 TaxID=1182545 RepID=A0A072PAT4_9EURO|nr:uncharacterized protein A1O9_11102 [Exophiala aquamarina CBS 119918]KEF52685.1 hypothetical protein A1O9_11102 [Exophiala aquamarina CBS 119918]
MNMGGACRISMTWNWYTLRACFISKTWQVTSSGILTGLCVGVICLVISLEFLRRVQREYDAFTQRQDRERYASVPFASRFSAPSSEHEFENGKNVSIGFHSVRTTLLQQPQLNRVALLQRQILRALLHTLHFGVAYFVLLIAMYYNGYIIICILIGAFLGSFISSWDQLLNENW